MAVNHAFYKREIIKRIDASGYDENPKTDKEKLAFLKKTFKSEYGYAINQMGEQRALAEWLQGLPSSIDLPFYNNEIIEFAKKGGSLPANPTEAQIDKVLENYWNFMAGEIRKAW